MLVSLLTASTSVTIPLRARSTRTLMTSIPTALLSVPNSNEEEPSAKEQPYLYPVIDIGVNLNNKAFRHRWREITQGAIDAGVDTVIVTGTSVESSKAGLDMAETWYQENGRANLYCTVGVHPHDAKGWRDENGKDGASTRQQLKDLLNPPKCQEQVDTQQEEQTPRKAIAVGECGLDYNRLYSSKESQIHAFRQQVQLAQERDLPLFVHEREAHEDLVHVLDDCAKEAPLPPIVVHCFTGTEQEALTYIERGYYLGFTGTICKAERGGHLRELLPKLPLHRLMVETDAPFMGFPSKTTKRKRKRSDPADCVEVADQVAVSMGLSAEEVYRQTRQNTLDFFRLS